MPEVTDLQKVAQYAKSSGAPSDVYNAACRMLAAGWPICSCDGDPVECSHEAARGEAEETIERVKVFAAELRTYCSPYGISSVYADTLETVLTGPESHRDGRAPQTLGAGEGQATTEAHGAVDVRPASMRRRVDFDTNGDPL